MGAFLSRIWSIISRRPTRRNFVYTDVLDRHSIRLLQFVQPKWYTFGLQSPRLVLATYPIHDLPKFVALSYTWGHPHDQTRGVLQAYQRQFPVFVDGQPFYVLKNLREALDSLLWFWDFKDNVQHLWIDAICINQNDITERAVQVGIMDQIFMRANTTAVWLGQSLSNSRKTMHILNKMLKVPSTELMSYYRNFPNCPPPPAEFWEHHGLPNVDDYDAWRPLTQFFEHRWFNRAWIIQEVTLSTRNIHLFWGHHALTWAELGHVSFVGQVAKIGKLNSSTTAAQNQEERPSSDCAVDDPLTNSFQLYYNRQRYLERSGRTTDDSLLQEMKALTGAKVPNAASWLMYFCMVNRWADATDPRDKVFSHLGLVNNIVDNDGLAPSSIQPCYSLDVTHPQIYQRLMSQVIEETDTLAILVALNDPPREAESPLPSWVPDLSTRRGLDLMSSIRPHFDVCKLDSRPQTDERRITVDKSTLRVRVNKIGQVSTLSASLADLLGPQWHAWTQDVLCLNPIYSLTGESRVEAFWRTLLMNSVGRNYPAQWPETEDGDMFRAYILQNIAQHFPGGGNALEKYLQELQDINELAKADVSGHMPSFTGLESLTTQMLNLSLDDPVSFTEETMAERLAQCVNRASEFVMGMDGSLLNRRIVMSSQGHVCNVPLQVERSDTIAIVDGCPCPVILRPSTGGFTLIGTAYVHGIMHGELISDTIEWEEMCIV